MSAELEPAYCDVVDDCVDFLIEDQRVFGLQDVLSQIRSKADYLALIVDQTPGFEKLVEFYLDSRSDLTRTAIPAILWRRA